MIIRIDAKLTIGELQRNFQRQFPFLKLEFFNQPYAWEYGNEDGINYHPSFKLGKIALTPFSKSLLNVQPWHTPAQLEEKLMLDFGLIAQVYRRFEDQWIQTDGSDDVSLSEQNELGKCSAERCFSACNLWVEREKII